MEIHVLKVTVFERDLNELAGRSLKRQPVEDVVLRLTPEGLHIHGTYPLFVNVKFETRWELAIQGGKVHARLAHIRALGLPGNMFKATVLKVLADAAKGHDWLQVDDQALVVDVDTLLTRHGLPARTNLASLTCGEGMLILEAGAQMPGSRPDND